MAQSPEDLFQQARTLDLVSGDTARAIEIYERIIEADNRSETRALALLELGRLYGSAGMRQVARVTLDRVVTEYPDSAEIVGWARGQMAALRRFPLDVPYTEDYLSFAISPDGSQLVYSVSAGSSGQLWLHDLLTNERHPIEGATIADPTYESRLPVALPFWSPDGTSIGYYSGEKLKTINVAGGTAKTLADVVYPRRGSWSANGTILFSSALDVPGPARTFMVPADGSSAAKVLDIGDAACPQFFPDGRRFLVFREDLPFVWFGAIDEPGLTLGGVKAFIASIIAPDRLVYVPEGELFWQQVDLATLNGVGAATPIAGPISGAPGTPCLRGVSVAASGAVAFRTTRGYLPRMQLVRLTREGTPITATEPDVRGTCCVRLSPDSSRAVLGRVGDSPQGGVWVVDLEGAGDGELSIAGSRYGVWSPDGDSLVAGVMRDRGPQGPGRYLELIRLGDSETRLVLPIAGVRPVDWSRDGSLLLYEEYVDRDLYAVPFSDAARVEAETAAATAWISGAEPIPVAVTAAVEQRGRFSPDARWVAFQSDEIDDRFEIFVQPLGSGPQARRRVSFGGGMMPAWRGDGAELYFLSASWELMAVKVSYTDGEDIEIGEPVTLFRVPPGSEFDVAADGETFLVNQLVDIDRDWPINIVMDWDE